MSTISRCLSLGVLAACAISLPARSQESAPAATEREGALEEIVVTARRRDESLQNVPISVIARSADYLEKARVESMTELSRVVPGFVFEEFEAGGASTMGIRGLATFSNQVAAQQSVGMLVDDVVLDTIGQAITEFNDIDRIEVLRGPQGTLFGKNTTGGVVHIVTNDPTDDFELKASMSYGSYDEVKVNGTINGQVADDLAARASAFAVDRDGYIENIHDGQSWAPMSRSACEPSFFTYHARRRG